MNKRGLSTVVTTVILIAIVLLLLVIGRIVVKNIEVKPDNTESCSDVFEKLEIDSKYTYYNQSSNELQFSISVGNVEVDEVLVSISGEETTKSLTITNKAQTIPGLTAYQSGSKIKLPGKNTCLTYIYDMRGFSNKPDSIEISPIMGGAQCEVCDSLYEINTETAENSSCVSNCSCASNTCVGSNCPNGCGGTCAGILKPDCGTRECGEAPNSCGSANECGTCNENYTCNTNNGTCVKTNQTCEELGGTICTGEQYCSGEILSATDSERCCNASCEEPVCTSCDTCGKGLFNICDRAECYACTSDTCYFLDGVDCFSCTGATCESYDNDQQTCSDNPCGLTSCEWDGSGCVEIIQSCTNDCLTGQTQCTEEAYIQHCGDYDDDSCLEFGPPEPCPQGQSCSGMACIDDNDVIILESRHMGYYDVGPGQTRYFKFVAGISDCLTDPIQVSNTPQPNQPHTVFMLIKKGSKPTLDDFHRTWQMPPSKYDCDFKQWNPAKPGAENLYWQYTTGTEFVEIGEPMESNTFYIMLYNDGTRNVLDQRLIVYY